MTRIGLVSGSGTFIATLRPFDLTTINPADLPREPERAAAYLAATGIQIVVVGPDIRPDLAFSMAGQLRRIAPEIDVLMLQPPKAELLIRAMQAGVRCLVSPGTGADKLTGEIRRMSEEADLRRSRLLGPAAAADAAGDGPQRRGVTTVMSAKGGTGKTTVAVNLASMLARVYPNEVVLVDLDLMAGDSDVYLGIEPSSTVASVAAAGALLELTVIKLSLIVHPSGLLVLPAPSSLVEADAVDISMVGEMLALLGEGFRHVVVDTAPGGGEPLVTAVEATDNLLLVASPDVGSLRSLRRNLDGLDSLGLNGAVRHLVVNHADARTGLAGHDIESAIGLPAAITIPESRELATAANQGISVIDTHPKAQTVAAFRDLAKLIDQTAGPVPAAPGPPPTGRRGGRQARSA
ncbi:MAG: CpaE family protein [Acidimicrobiales bacterium]